MFSPSLKIVHNTREGQAIHIACRVQKPRPSLTLNPLISQLALWPFDGMRTLLLLQYLNTAWLQKQQLKVVN